MKLSRLFLVRSQTAFTLGRLLKVDLPQLGLKSVTAKIDTGAYSGSLHATDIREVKVNRVNHLQFRPYSSATKHETTNYHSRRVKSSNGAPTPRYAIDTEISIGGRLYPITLTLADRTTMRNPLLIGRKFIREQNFLVDVNLDADKVRP